MCDLRTGSWQMWQKAAIAVDHISSQVVPVLHIDQASIDERIPKGSRMQMVVASDENGENKQKLGV